MQFHDMMSQFYFERGITRKEKNEIKEKKCWVRGEEELLWRKLSHQCS